ncbi:MAG TPA: hypothetical protein VEW94_03370 [Chloroflexia bacterium]|nr:hypothetical protein [Chloroflexia bacterium]
MADHDTDPKLARGATDDEDDGDGDGSTPSGAPPPQPKPVPSGDISRPITGLLDLLRVQSTQDCTGPTFANYVMLWGYLYEGPCDCSDKKRRKNKEEKDATWRLYLSLDFKEYIEFNEDSFIKQIDLFTASQPLAGSLVWIKKDAPVRRIREKTAEDEADFLQGAITSGSLGSSSPSTMFGLGMTALLRRSRDPGTGGGCGTGGAFSSCE